MTVVDGCNMQHPSGGFPYSATYRPYSIQQNINGQGWKSNYSIQFWTDAPKFEVAWVNRGPVTYRVWADDAAVGSLVPVVKTTTGNAESIVVDFTGVGGAIPRRIRVDLTWADFAGIVVPSSAYSIWPAKQRGPTVFMIGDSLTGGSGHSSSYGNQIPHVLGQLLGWDNVWNLGIGGTGYATKNAPSSFDNSALPQVQYLAPSSATPSLAAPGSSLPTPDIVIVSHGHNDAPTWTAAVTAAGNTLAQARAQWPTALIFVTSALGNSSATGEGSFLTSNEAALFAAVAPYVDATISAWTGPGRPWLTGTGNTSATTGSGNGDLYIGSDSVHWNDAGILYVGARLASEILGLLRG
ncbi:SGNH/GDSL hydrolase family protein [Mycobacteroides abscessus]|uniref:SGNH/GDSL hydrolase family protein n=1 Tax=Mycobacteroides abscessus TaxID=36809 RepID=UPI0013FCF5DB|nr:SGNH/GDSL hydrolase family protein [Mycobacteroides abscessus]